MIIFSREMYSDLNLYDTKIIHCIECTKPIGEIDYDAKVIYSLCRQCDDTKHDVKEKLVYRMEIPVTKNMTNPITI